MFATLVKSYKGLKLFAQDQKEQCNWESRRKWTGMLNTRKEGASAGWVGELFIVG